MKMNSEDRGLRMENCQSEKAGLDYEGIRALVWRCIERGWVKRPATKTRARRTTKSVVLDGLDARLAAVAEVER